MTPAATSVETHRTTCNRDCPDACSILVTVDRGTGRALKLQGDPDHPITQGFLCKRTSRFLERQYSDERVTTPLVRKNGELRPASWDEALDLVASQLQRIKRESGPEAIFHYRSGGSLGLLKPLSDHLFEKFGPVTGQRGDICSGGGEAAQTQDFGVCDANDVHDVRHSRSILLWGKNPYVSSPHLLPILKESKARGARLALIDPVRHRTADLCDLFVQPRPGSDASLALGIARWLFENGKVDPEAARYCENLAEFRALAFEHSLEERARECEVRPDEIVSLARLYSESPAVIYVGWGMGRRVNGASIVRTVDALATITGNMGRPGGGSLFYWRRRYPFDLSFVQLGSRAPRTISEPLFGPELLAAKDPPVRAVWITCGNPVVMLPESATVARALETRELVVVVDSFLTDTARRAHVFFPTTTLLEDDDLLGAYGHHWLGVARPVIERPPEVKTDLEILQALAARLGLADVLAGTARDWKRRLLAPLTRESGVTLEQIEQGYVKSPRAKQVLFEGNRFPTPSGKARLLANVPVAASPRDGEFPLKLLSVSTDETQAAQTSSAVQRSVIEVTVHPDSAAGFANGAAAHLASRIGKIPVRVRHDARQRRDVALLPKGGWFDSKRAANALTRARTTDFGEGAAYYDEDVRLEA